MGYCNLNKKNLSTRPEEIVRQKALIFLKDSLQFPKDLIIVEKMLSDLNTSGLPCPVNRRVDILCYTPSLNGLKPLLLIECKAVSLTVCHQDQLEGYNQWIQAPFVALISHQNALIGRFNPVNLAYEYEEGLLSYPQLLKYL